MQFVRKIENKEYHKKLVRNRGWKSSISSIKFCKSIATQEHLWTRDKMHLWGAFHRRRFLGSVAEPIGIQKCERGENIEI
jgi:hypothetical protein